MSPTPTFHIRGLREGAEDGEFMIASYNASLAHLASIGSGGQWGTETLAERGRMDERTQIYEQAQRYQATGEGDPIRIFIIEAEVGEGSEGLPADVHIRTDDAGRKLLAVGCVQLSEGLYPYYLRPHFDQEALAKALDGPRDYIYLEALITDYRTGPWRKGAGAKMLEYSEQFCRGRGKSILYLDAYSGNDRKLIKYYEGQGYYLIDDFAAPKPDGSKWPGAVLRKDLV